MTEKNTLTIKSAMETGRHNGLYVCILQFVCNPGLWLLYINKFMLCFMLRDIQLP